MKLAGKSWMPLLDTIIDEWAGITFPRPVVALGEFKPTNGCYWCGAEMQSDVVCACMRARLHWSRVIRLGAYEEPLSDCILGGKYTAWKDMLEHLGAMLGRKLRGCVPPNSILVPIPMPPIRRCFRRINHTGVIAKHASLTSGIPIRRALWRKECMPQASKSASERTLLHRNSILLRPLPMIKGRNAILIDDVLTTGRTLEVAANKLKSARVASVRVAVLAVTKMSQNGKKM
ncbi:MAG: ComF family protein [Phycisphaerae bacterium]|jgi:predicted amidophosphoribosyltransferase|nr:ComF family protein [Phycisphaerae bacterium]MBT5365510.1 ComF family protein [Phycisphaerae bacterium]MBT6268745.1 ComF family protein [Phycisphaerae bacterium]MBT6282960.1 ComF family protein [Phycisphaerae bacterium]